jgi:hypothetical protein|tara:strand:+ start:261 stop:479 length:219 start_codon:yes stop_codon:yes gene_type:complete
MTDEAKHSTKITIDGDTLTQHLRGGVAEMEDEEAINHILDRVGISRSDAINFIRGKRRFANDANNNLILVDA